MIKSKLSAERELTVKLFDFQKKIEKLDFGKGMEKCHFLS